MKSIITIVLLLLSLNLWSQTNKSLTQKRTENFEVVIQSPDNLNNLGFRNDISGDVLRHFMKSFEDAQNVLWRVNENGTSVSFSINNQSAVGYYDKQGYHLKTIKFYDEKELDPTVAGFAKKLVGKDFSIYLVTELIKDNYTIYDISFQNSKYWCKVKLLRRPGGSLEQFSENVVFRKA